jgi:hypothetical protein
MLLRWVPYRQYLSNEWLTKYPYAPIVNSMVKNKHFLFENGRFSLQKQALLIQNAP